MLKSIAVGTALLLATAAIGVAVADNFKVLDGPNHEFRQGRHARADGSRPVVALGTREHGRHGEEHRRRLPGGREDDDNDDEGGERGGPSSLSQNGPSDPNTAVRDNGLFNGKGRPKVQVQ